MIVSSSQRKKIKKKGDPETVPLRGTAHDLKIFKKKYSSYDLFDIESSRDRGYLLPK